MIPTEILCWNVSARTSSLEYPMSPLMTQRPKASRWYSIPPWMDLRRWIPASVILLSSGDWPCPNRRRQPPQRKTPSRPRPRPRKTRSCWFGCKVDSHCKPIIPEIITETCGVNFCSGIRKLKIPKTTGEFKAGGNFLKNFCSGSQLRKYFWIAET